MKNASKFKHLKRANALKQNEKLLEQPWLSRGAHLETTCAGSELKKFENLCRIK
jgi:hypothetical protein